MADRVKGITIEIGGDTTGLSKALGDVNRKISTKQTQLKDVERLLKLDPTNIDLLAQKQRLLAEAIEKTEDKLQAVKDAERQVQEQFQKGDASIEQYEAVQREVVDTEQALQRLKDKAADTDAALDKIDDNGSLSRLEEDVKKVTTALDNAAEKTKGFSEKAAGVSSAFKPVTAAVGGLAAAAVATVPATEELREDLSRLDQNAKESGAGVDEAREACRKFAVQSGETDSAVEAVSNLLQAGFTESNLQTAVEGLAGAAQRFPDTMKVESLADSLQETLATGEATGQFGELLDRLGIGAENFNEKLAACGSTAEMQDLALQTLAEQGLNDTYNAWVENNDEMIANKEASLEWEETMAKVAEEVLPLVTQVTEFASDLVNKFLSLDEGTRNFLVVIVLLLAAISPVAGIVSKTSAAFSSMSTIISFISQNPIVLLIAAIVALVALIATKGDEIQALLQKLDDWLQGVFAKDWTEVFGSGLGDILNGFFANVKNIWDSIKKIFDGIIDFIRGVFTGDWERAWKGVKEIFCGVFDSLKAVARAPLNAIIALVNGVISGINALIGGLNKIPGVNIGTIGKIPYLAKGGVLSSGSAIVGEAGPELLTVDGSRAVVQPLTNQTSNNYSLGGMVFNITAAPGQDVNELADVIAERIEDVLERREAVFA